MRELYVLLVLIGLGIWLAWEVSGTICDWLER